MTIATDYSPRAGWLVWLFRLQFAAALAVFTYLTLSPNPALSAAANDKVWHFVGNLLFFLSARLAWLRTGHWWFALIFVMLYGCAMEFGQNFVPQRSFDYSDMLANVSGVLVGALLSLIIQWCLVRWQQRAVAGVRAQP